MGRHDCNKIERSDSQSTSYSDVFDEYTEEMGLEVDRAAASAGSTSASQSSAAQSSSTPSESLKRKRAFFSHVDLDEAVPLPVSKSLKIASSSSKSSSYESMGGEQTPIWIPAEKGKSLHSYMRNLPIGLVWELARLFASAPSDASYPHPLFRLKGSTNAAVAPKAREIALEIRGDKSVEKDGKDSSPSGLLAAAYAQEKAAKLPWKELDKEEDFEKEARALGKEAFYLAKDDEDWHGGKVHFTGKLKRLGNSKTQRQYVIELDKPYLGSSNRFTRRFGSKRIVSIKIEQQLLMSSGKDLIQYFKRPLIIFDRVFRAFYAKEGHVLFFQTYEFVNKDEVRNPQIGGPSWPIYPPLDKSLLEFLEWHNPLLSNKNQTMAKWKSRMALGLSNSVPGLLLKAECLHRIPDIECPNLRLPGKVPTEAVMTDGCGFANARFFELLQHKFQWDSYPTAVQVRVHGAKGLLTLHPEHCYTTPGMIPEVWIREPSQTKISYPPGYDPAHYVVDVLRSSHMSSPSHLSVETIINLAENGVKVETLAELMKVNFTEKVDGLTTWAGDNGYYILWQNVLNEGHVVAARLARQETGTARAKGYIYEDAQEEFEDENMDEDTLEDRLLRETGESSTAWWEDPISGQPSSLEETVLRLLDAGFVPQSEPVLRSKLKYVAQKSIKTLTNKFRITVPMSASGFVIPDPCGVLEPGEVHIKSSRRNLQDQDGALTEIVLGDVLLTRHPCKVPSDIQLAKAVYKHELRNYVDVVIVSTKGHILNNELLPRHLASMTGGGDFDGDLMSVYWQPELVRDFKPADKRFASEPDALADCIQKDNESVEAFIDRLPENPLGHMTELQTHLLAGLKDASLVGTISTWWEYSAFKNGYDHAETVLLAYLFCAVLDGSKTGLTVKQDKFKEFKKTYDKRPPAWKQPIDDSEDKDANKRPDMFNLPTIRRSDGLGSRFVMDVLKDEAKKAYDHQIRVISERLGDLSRPERDEDLVGPWDKFTKKADRNPSLKQIQDILQRHVGEVFREWKNRAGENTGSKGHVFTKMAIEERQDILRKLSLKFAQHPQEDVVEAIYDAESVARLKASCAYKLVWPDPKRKDSNSSYRFPFDVAMGSLCRIKARARSNGTEKTVAHNFYSRMVLHRKFRTD